MASFKILIADDDRVQRGLISSLSLRERSQLEIDKVVNPAQAQIFFNKNRNKACSLCMLLDGDMSKHNNKYIDTTIAHPREDDPNLAKTSFDDLVAMAKDWQSNSRGKVFIARHSSDDKVSTALKNIDDFPVNNFNKPFIWRKGENDYIGYIKAIFSHCDKIFRA